MARASFTDALGRRYDPMTDPVLTVTDLKAAAADAKAECEATPRPRSRRVSIVVITAVMGMVAGEAHAQGLFTPQELRALGYVFQYGPQLLQQPVRPFPQMGPPPSPFMSNPQFRYVPPPMPFQYRQYAPSYGNFGPVRSPFSGFRR